MKPQCQCALVSRLDAVPMGTLQFVAFFLDLVHSRNNPTTDNIREFVKIYICSGVTFESVAQ